MALYDDFKKYRDIHGFNQPDTDGAKGIVSQNGALFCMEYLVCLMNDPTVPENIKQAEVERLRKAYQAIEKFPGVSCRVPGGNEYDSMDNTVAIFSFSGLYDNGEFSKRSYEHGKNTRAKAPDMVYEVDDNKKWFKILNVLSLFRGPRFFWNCTDPKAFCFFGWHGRSPGHMAFLKMTAGKWVGPFGQLVILVSQFLGCFNDVKDLDARKLPYLEWQYLKKRNIFWNLAYKLWCHILMKQYPNGMIDVYSRYYSDKNHPLIKYSQKFIK